MNRNRNRILTAVALAAIAATGALTALTLAPAALAWSPGNLPPGWTADHIAAVNAPSCPSSYRIWNDTRTAFSNPICEDSPTYQADFDAWVNAHYTPPAPTTTAPAATTAATTTTPPAVTTTPATTTTAPATTTTPAPTPPPAATTVAATPAAPAAPPVADFTASTPTPLTIAYTDASTPGTAAITSRVWQFGDGAAGVGPSVSRTYTGPGTYFVTLIVVDASGLTSLAVRQLTIAADRTIVLGPRQTQAVSAKTAAAVKAAALARAKAVARAKAAARAKALAKTKAAKLKAAKLRAAKHKVAP